MQVELGVPMAAVFAAPGKYIQGRGALGQLGEVLGQLGSSRSLLLRDAVVAGLVGDSPASVRGAFPVDFGGENSPSEIDRVLELAREEGADAIVGVGGGKTIDTAKAVAHPAGLPLVTVPTVAATDAPTSSVTVVYGEGGTVLEYRFFGKNPDAVVVDTAIIARAPVRFLVAGIGDGLSTYFEADASSRTRKQAIAGGAPTYASLALARLCYDTLLEHGVAAKLACERDAVTPALERVVEASTLLSGLGFESGGLAAAHSIHNGLTALDATHRYWHGEKVAFGVVSMLMLEERPAEVLEEVVGFCLEVGLPVTLDGVGLGGVGQEVLTKVARAACAEGETIHNMPFEISTPRWSRTRCSPLTPSAARGPRREEGGSARGPGEGTAEAISGRKGDRKDEDERNRLRQRSTGQRDPRVAGSCYVRDRRMRRSLVRRAGKQR